jgi:hypothetical protein
VWCRRGLMVMAAVALVAGCGGGHRSLAGPPVTVRIMLDQAEVIQGGVISGVAVITNATGKPVRVDGSCGLSVEVYLHNRQASSGGGTLSDAQFCTAPVYRVPRGVSRIPITVKTDYGGCAMTVGGTGSPKCVGPENLSPPLPPGAYMTGTTTEGFPAATPSAPEVPVTVLAAHLPSPHQELALPGLDATGFPASEYPPPANLLSPTSGWPCPNPVGLEALTASLPAAAKAILGELASDSYSQDLHHSDRAFWAQARADWQQGELPMNQNIRACRVRGPATCNQSSAR